MKRDEVSIGVGIPCYNHERYVGEAIDSVLRQTWPPSEILVIDDGSTDDSVRQIEKAFARAGSVRCRLVARENRGIPVTRNELLAGLHSDVIAMLDSDDLYREDRFERMLERIPRAERFISFSGVSFLNHLEANEAGEFFRAYAELLRLAGRLPTAGFAILVSNPAVTASNLLFSRSLVEQVGPFDSHMPFSEEWDFLLRSVRCVEPRLVADRLLTYRLHATSSAKRNPDRNRLFRFAYGKLPDWLHGPVPNPLAPIPENWPGYLRLFAHICRGRVAEEPLAAVLPRGFLEDNRECSREGRAALQQLLLACREAELDEMEPVSELLERCERTWSRN